MKKKSSFLFKKTLDQETLDHCDMTRMNESNSILHHTIKIYTLARTWRSRAILTIFLKRLKCRVPLSRGLFIHSREPRNHRG